MTQIIAVGTAGRTVTGKVKLTGKTIGNPDHDATEQANKDSAALFAYLWEKHDRCPTPSR